MTIAYSLGEFTEAKNSIVTTGTFDGVHFGHQKIISRMKELARNIGGETIILSFFPHPRMILHPEDEKLKLLTSKEEKIRLMKSLEVDHLLLIPFSRDFSNMSSRDFVKKILVDSLKTHTLVIGYDHRFGKDREGNFEELVKMGTEWGFEVEEIPEQDINTIAVSSTKIRKALADGDIHSANTYLDYPYSLSGTVIKGDQIGRTLGYPTANIFVEDSNKLIPAEGIYAVKVYLDQESYLGMLYIGKRPVLNKVHLSIEVNIFDFKETIYGKNIRVDLYAFIRHDANFKGLDLLIEQMGKDKIQVTEFFKNHNPY